MREQHCSRASIPASHFVTPRILPLPPATLLQVSHMEHIFIRGSRVRFVVVPDMLKNAPMVSRLRCAGGSCWGPCAGWVHIVSATLNNMQSW